MAAFPRVLAITASVLLLASGPPQDPEPDAEFVQSVRALIVQLKDKNKVVRTKAEEDLFQLGPRAIPILRVEESRLSPGELKQKLGIIVKRIERVQRKAIASGSTLQVAVSAKDQPILELLAELQKKTSVPIEQKGIAADAVITLEADGLSLWEAIDQVCKTNGRLTWDVSGKGIALKKETYARPTMANVMGFALVFRGFQRFPPGPGTGDRDYIRSDVDVAGPPGLVSISESLSYEALVDDKGTDLTKSPSGLVFKPSSAAYRMLPDPDMARHFYGGVADVLEAFPARNATKIATCKGVAKVRAVVEMEKRYDIRGPNLKKGAKDSGFGVDLLIEVLDITGNKVRIEVAVTDTRVSDGNARKIFHPLGAGKIVLRDAAGRDLGATFTLASPTSTVGGPAGGANFLTTKFKAQAEVKPDSPLAAVEIWEPALIEEIKIPFDLKDIPIRKAK